MKLKLLLLIASLYLIPLGITAQSAPLGKGMLWEISGNGLKKKSYLLGTIHMIPAEDYYFPKHYVRALKSSKRIVMEIDITNFLAQFEVLTMMKMKGMELKDLYDDSTYKKMVKTCKDSFDIDLEKYKDTKPIFVQQQLATGGILISDSKSYEVEIMKMGFEMDKTFGGLETAKEQMMILDSIPLAEQANMLYESIYNGKKDNSELLKLVKFYKEQNLDSLNAIFEKGEYGLANHEQSLLGNRNRKWIPMIERFIKAESTFIAVGAGHLAGEQGVINLLRKAGYTLKPILK